MADQKHYVTFYSPGTLFAETSEKEVPAWDVMLAIELARGVKERYGAKPWGFSFDTREAGFTQPKIVKSSPVYHLGGKVLTIANVEALPDADKHDILIGNMKSNGWDRVVQNKNSWLSYQPFVDGAVLLDPETGKTLEVAK